MKRRWGFRARLTALIATVFIAGGAVLLSVQYLLAQQLIDEAARTVTTVTLEPLEACMGGVCTVPTPGPDGTAAASFERTVQLTEGVFPGLLGRSVLILGLFAVVAVIAAGWLSRRSLERIAEITAATRQINRDNLDRRLGLLGPDDEIKELGDTIDGMLDRLDDAFTRQDRFIAGASHELRTPLTAVRAAIEIPLIQGRVPAPLEPELRSALAASERSERLIDALLTLARADRRESARVAPTAGVGGTVTTDVGALVTAAVDELRGAAGQRDIRLTVSIADPATAIADPALVGIAVRNVLDNAIRHNREGGEAAVTVGADADRVWLDVVNDGHPIADADAALLIEPFNRGDESRLAGGGLGLGLTLVQAIVRSQGGELVVAARRGGGLGVRFTLPAR